ncbi:MAG: MgtC/SapB family protein [Acholeplasmatales bacterium]|jgi:putative Mg2+ transporter-C (MgtC) family protein|nr:MgtC/SapB family protein [Acholeplasmatales bacterium]
MSILVIDKSLISTEAFLGSIILPLALVFVLTAAIGFERQNIGKAAGLTSHIFVGISACGVAIMQRLMFEETLELVRIGLQVEASPSRIIAQVVTGIGFIGAGVILKDNSNMIKGITTAATLFATAMIGIIIGSGYLTLGGILSFIIIIFLYSRDLSRKVNPFINHRLEKMEDHHQ